MESLPFSYLGLPLGANPKRAATWNPVILKIQKKLATWKGRLLSLAGRITLIRAALSIVPIYFLSLFKIPKKVALKIEQIIRTFLWAGDADCKKLSLVKWGCIGVGAAATNAAAQTTITRNSRTARRGHLLQDPPTLPSARSSEPTQGGAAAVVVDNAGGEGPRDIQLRSGRPAASSPPPHAVAWRERDHCRRMGLVGAATHSITTATTSSCHASWPN
ncbi:hypothetical protein Tsubulata_019649 [Turnera subulata]|uniref:Uncharacterized protein n=1 Tax=Turnera subulata TaxID=218843 RepID=A0A9Q0JBK8_9ROSI|nr:hypothetical protein Tsubulata_019649 [Turnera subulata]